MLTLDCEREKGEEGSGLRENVREKRKVPERWFVFGMINSDAHAYYILVHRCKYVILSLKLLH